MAEGKKDGKERNWLRWFGRRGPVATESVRVRSGKAEGGVRGAGGVNRARQREGEGRKRADNNGKGDKLLVQRTAFIHAI
ncbi:hypothetical protein E2562_035985 [Oryza meyeriana var. granulata]|uniref:Uncharacterized protein n=1 Tax=Oryza meyeriana var. granulata TaxID=110450 RepID=A0A6G1ESW8_9ORYZ|nr:hypothetical protein E2562_035985 [Oryza meyeriana var. granulata]